MELVSIVHGYTSTRGSEYFGKVVKIIMLFARVTFCQAGSCVVRFVLPLASAPSKSTAHEQREFARAQANESTMAIARVGSGSHLKATHGCAFKI